MERAYAGRGSDAYHPAMLLALLIYGYATRTFSRRKLERATYDALAFRYIACNRHPDHDTLASFRKRFGGEFEAAFIRICNSNPIPGKARATAQHGVLLYSRVFLTASADAMRDRYEVLGISPTASPDEIKSAYRQAARLYHPDRNPAPEAAARFREAQSAYALLSDEAKRREYDALRRRNLLDDPLQEATSLWSAYIEKVIA